MQDQTSLISTPNPSDRLIQGDILKCVDGRWSERDGAKMLVLGYTRALECWQNKKLVDTVVEQPGVTLTKADAEKRNAEIPKDEWTDGLNGEPEPPWRLQFVVYVLDPTDASVFTVINSTWGMKKAFDRLTSRIEWMRALRGSNVTPVVALSSAPMPTSYGMKKRPDFAIDSWRELGVGLKHTATPQIEDMTKPVKPVSVSEEINDELPGDLAPKKTA